MSKIKILGAGLSGLTAAINLAKKGYEVEIFEKNKECGIRFNNDFQGLENWSSQTDILANLISMNIKINFYCKPFHTMQFYDSELNKINAASKKPIFYLVRRGNTNECLDIVLKKQAMDLGVKINFNEKILEKNVDIIATGPKYVSGVVRGITFKTKSPNTAILIFNDNIAPKGYTYLLVENNIGTLAVVVLKNLQNANLYIEKAKNTFNKLISLNMKEIKYFGGYGGFHLCGSYERDKKLIVGEAAGLQDFLFGFGMKYAITSGYLAAKSIIENKEYNKLIKHKFENQLKTSVVNRFLFEKFGNTGYKFILNRIKNVGITAFLNKYYNHSITKKLIYSLSKFTLRKRI